MEEYNKTLQIIIEQKNKIIQTIKNSSNDFNMINNLLNNIYMLDKKINEYQNLIEKTKNNEKNDTINANKYSNDIYGNNIDIESQNSYEYNKHDNRNVKYENKKGNKIKYTTIYNSKIKKACYKYELNAEILDKIEKYEVKQKLNILFLLLIWKHYLLISIIVKFFKLMDNKKLNYIDFTIKKIKNI